MGIKFLSKSAIIVSSALLLTSCSFGPPKPFGGACELILDNNTHATMNLGILLSEGLLASVSDIQQEVWDNNFESIADWENSFQDDVAIYELVAGDEQKYPMSTEDKAVLERLAKNLEKRQISKAVFEEIDRMEWFDETLTDLSTVDEICSAS